MKEKCEMTKFREGDTKEHEGITYKAVYQEPGEYCKGCAFYKRGEPCKGPRGWLCVEIEIEIGKAEEKDLIFKKVE